jgi:RNA polymerase sigma-70 factor, ECF subfamily
MLAEEFLAHLEEGQRARVGAHPEELERVLRDLVASAGAAWPGVSLSTERYIHHLAARLGDGDPAALRGPDLFLACACGERDPAALAAFEAAYAVEIGAVLAKMRALGPAADELRQRLRQKLFVDGAIAEYAGSGELRSWLRVVLVRLALNARRDEKRHVTLEDGMLLSLAVPADDPELEIMKRAYRRELEGALQEAVQSLPAREKNLLYLHFVDGLPIERLGALHRVHRTTASRWLASAQQALLAGTRRALMARLAVGRAELDSILRLIQSRIELNLETVLASRAD